MVKISKKEFIETYKAYGLKKTAALFGLSSPQANAVRRKLGISPNNERIVNLVD